MQSDYLGKIDPYLPQKVTTTPGDSPPIAKLINNVLWFTPQPEVPLAQYVAAICYNAIECYGNGKSMTFK